MSVCSVLAAGVLRLTAVGDSLRVYFLLSINRLLGYDRQSPWQHPEVSFMSSFMSVGYAPELPRQKTQCSRRLPLFRKNTGAFPTFVLCHYEMHH